MTKVELFEVIRRDKFLHEKSIREIAREQGVHRRMVRQALDNAVPRVRKPEERVPTVLTTEMRGQVDRWLRADHDAPKKQRHTARRIFQRLRDELEYQGAESTLRRYVGSRRREMGLHGEAFVPLTHAPGLEAEVDWGEADVDFPWGRERVNFFQMRACFSGREFNMAFPRQTQQAFLEAHVEAFSYFGGVFECIRYDNLSSAVQKVLRGRRRIETDRFVSLRSHYVFTSEFCRPGKEGAHEKGGVEGGIGRFRRSHLVPVPQVESYEALNRMLFDQCARDDLRMIEGRQSTILDDWKADAKALRALPRDPFDSAEAGTVEVNTKGCVRVATNHYSVPIRLTRRRVEFRLHALKVELMHEGRIVASHPRQQGKHGIRLKLDHYIELLWNKPGALKRSLPLRQARDRGEWPAAYDTLQVALSERFDENEATRQILSVLMMHREHTADEVLVAVEVAMEHGCFDAGAISVILRQLTGEDLKAEPLSGLGALTRYDRPMAALTEYDQLLTRPSAMEVH
jgi:transposase